MRTRSKWAVIVCGLAGGVMLGSSVAALEQVTCWGERATITGTDGDDRLTGTAEDDVIAALGGNDVVETRGGTDRVCGNAGNDTLKRVVEQEIDNDDVAHIAGGRGNDRIEGGAGPDDPAAAEVFRGGAGQDQIYGFAGPDQLYGNRGKDYLDGGDGNDYTEGGDGRDECVNEEWKVSCET